jgi:hypothetical protein
MEAFLSLSHTSFLAPLRDLTILCLCVNVGRIIGGEKLLIASLDGSDYEDMEFNVSLLNSSQHTLNISIPIIYDVPMLQVSLRLLSDDFSCAAVEPSTAFILIRDVDEDEG